MHRKATANPWGAHGLEWQTASPPITLNFVETPIVTDEVYDFSHTDEFEQRRGTAEITHPGEGLQQDKHLDIVGSAKDGDK